MREDKKFRLSPPAVGGSSLLVIFAVLCLTIFALLSLSTVQADRRLGDASAAAVGGYYAADTQAEVLLAQLRTGEIPEGVEVKEEILPHPEDSGEQSGEIDPDTKALTVSYSCPISDTQELQVRIFFPDGLSSAYEILQWQAVSTADWQPDDTIHVWDGEMEE